MTIEAPDLCPRFCGRVLDVRMGPSPAWLRDRLEQMGVRPISNVVDLTNYVMLEMGQPSHAFDLARVPEGKLRVRWAREGERLKTLDGVDRVLHPKVGVVAGVSGPLALAGVMGGATSEVSEETRTVALEAAYWEPLAIRRAARSLGMHTEASHRFERGADPEGTVIGDRADRAPAGEDRSGNDAAWAHRPRGGGKAEAVGDPASGARAGGSGSGRAPRGNREDPARPRVRRCRARRGLEVQVPTWRSDVAREDDVVEEVGRHHGLDKIPSSLPPAADVGRLRPAQAEERAVRTALVAAGLTEVINYAFEGGAGANAVALANPLAEDQSVLRTALLPGLLRSLEANSRQGTKDVALFEVGRVFKPGRGKTRREAPSRPAPRGRRPSAALVGEAAAVRLSRSQGEPGVPVRAPRPEVDRVRRSKRRAPPGSVGRARRALASRAERDASVRQARLSACWERSGRVRTRVARTSSWPSSTSGHCVSRHPASASSPCRAFPGVDRDLSIVADKGVEAAEVERRIRKAAGPALVGVTVTDRYEGSPVPAGKVSLLLSLRYEDRERTLTGEEVQASVDKVIRELRAAGFDIRGE